VIDLDRALQNARKILSGYAAELSSKDRRELAFIVLDYKDVLKNLTSTQERCNELLNENRRLRGIPAE
jgi:hypothetical protein